LADRIHTESSVRKGHPLTRRAVLTVSLALVFVFAMSAMAYAYTCNWVYGNFTDVAKSYAYHKDFSGTKRAFLYNQGGLVVKYKSGGTWYTASNPAAFVRKYYNSYKNDSVKYHQSYTAKIADQINFHN
jgi:hypothetical protein